MIEALAKKADVVEGLFDRRVRDPMAAFDGADANWQQRRRHGAEKFKGSFEIAWELGH